MTESTPHAAHWGSLDVTAHGLIAPELVAGDAKPIRLLQACAPSPIMDAAFGGSAQAASGRHR